jgi:hypothetical protein
LTFETEEQAADSISSVLGSVAEQHRLRERLAARSDMFSTQRFVAEIQSIVRTFKA